MLIDAVDKGQVGQAGQLAVIVFSKDRPLQLDATLRSLQLHCADLRLASTYVLYTTSSASFAGQYRVLAAQHQDVTFVRESAFKQNLVDLVSKAPYVLFLVDDTLFVGSVSLRTAMQVLKEVPTCIGFSFRLGRNTTYCYTMDKLQALPAFEQMSADVVMYSWPHAEHDFGYPLEVASSVFRTSDILALAQSISYTNPNTLEAGLASRAPDLTESRPHLACYNQSRALSVPANLVQTAWGNRIDGRPELAAGALAEAFALGRRLDVERYRGYVPQAAHGEVDFHFVRDTSVPAVSVVIPCHNQALFLTDAVESVVAQTYQDWEIVIVDDGSTDDTADSAEELIQRHADRRIRLVRQQNAGLAEARNAGVRQSRGRFILPLDADDEIASEMLERCVDVLEATPPVAIVYTDLQRFGESSEVVAAADFDPTVLPSANLLNYCALYRREVWEAVHGYNPNMRYGYEDWDFWVGCAERGYTAHRVPLPLFRYRIREGSMYAQALAHDAELRRQLRANHPALYTPWRRGWRWAWIRIKGIAARWRRSRVRHTAHITHTP